ncbi:oxidoreductase domain-containing protein [Flammeovirgaceae bacterium 311]|nr:oxidoreductase domain-containing protein [Flammeovirgaceae bacterium 311]
MDQAHQKGISRRHFLQTALLGTAGFSILPPLAYGRPAPSDTINIGVIGLGRQAQGLTNTFLNIPGVKVVAGSDVYRVKRQRFEQLVNGYYQHQKKRSKIKTYEHYTDLLNRKDIDAVVIATPDHWHALMGIDACRAGKNVYLEKPLTFTIKEGQELVKAVRNNNRILAVGSQQRSSREFQHAVNLIREGKIGRVERINAHVGGPPVPYNLGPQPIPDGLNWELWLGPNPYVHYNPALNPPISLDPPQGETIWAAWRLYKETGGGYTTDWGAHMFDIAQWALNKDSSGPVEVIPPGYQDYDYLTYRYDDGVTMTERPYDEQKSRGIKFWGSDGWIEVTRGGFKSSDPSLDIQRNAEGGIDNTRFAHQLDFIAAIRNDRDPVVPVEVGHRTSTVCTLGNIAYELQRPVQWNPQQESFVNDAEADHYLHRPYREGYSLT